MDVEIFKIRDSQRVALIGSNSEAVSSNPCKNQGVSGFEHDFVGVQSEVSASLPVVEMDGKQVANEISGVENFSGNFVAYSQSPVGFQQFSQVSGNLAQFESGFA